MASTKDELVFEIGNLLGRAAMASAREWSYVAYVFSVEGGGVIGGQSHLFVGQDQVKLQTREIRRDLRESFLRLRDLTRVEGDDPWIRCLAMIRFEDRALRILFEFEDNTRWAIGPTNVRDAYRIIVGDIFPEDFE